MSGIEQIKQEVRAFIEATYGQAGPAVVDVMMNAYINNPEADKLEYWQSIHQSVSTNAAAAQSVSSAQAVQPSAGETIEQIKEQLKYHYSSVYGSTGEKMVENFETKPGADTLEFWQEKIKNIRDLKTKDDKPAAIPGRYICKEDNGGVVITEYKMSSTSPETEIDIPPVIDGKKVIGIRNRAFGNCGLNRVTIPEGVAFIGNESFKKNNFTSIAIPSSVKEIGENAFSYGALESVVIPDSVTSIGEGAFAKNKSLSSVTIPGSVKSIGEGAFNACALTSLTIGKGIETISKRAFADNALTNVIIPDTIKIIGEEAFKGNQISELTIGKGVSAIEEKAFSENKLSNVTVPDNVETIGKEAFNGNPLTLAVVPDNAKIDDRAFPSSLKTGLKKASVLAFENNNAHCAKPEDFEWRKTKDGKGVVIDKYTGKDTQIIFPPQIMGLPVIEIKQIRSNTLTSVVFPDSITEIGTHMLGFCGEISSVTIGKGVKTIGTYAFQKNKKLTQVIIPDNVETIGRGAFEDCGLTSLTIGNGVKKIEQNAFAGNQLTEVIIPGSVTTLERGAFYNNKLNSIIIPNSITVISMFAFGENKLKSVTLYSGITEIESSAFWNNNLKSITIPEGVKKIGAEAFHENKLVNLTLPDSITVICKSAFEHNSLESVKFGKGLINIEDRAFADNPKFIDIFIPDNVVTIASGAFTGPLTISVSKNTKLGSLHTLAKVIKR